MLPSIIREAATRFCDRPALVAAGGWPVSYADLDHCSDLIASGLSARGVTDGSVVALTLPSTPDYVAIYLAAAKLGAITTGVNPRLSATERARILAKAEPTLVVTTADLSDGIPAGVATTTITVASSSDAMARELQTDGPPPSALPDDADRVVAIVWTSGTTGEPKGAIFTNRELAAVVERDIDGRWGEGGPMLAGTQFAHVGFMTKLPWYLMSGGRLYLLDKWRASDALRLVAEHGMASVGGVAPQVALMLRDPDFDSHDLSTVKTIIMGGGASSPALVEEARRRFGAAYSIRYSSTESGGIGTGTAFDADDEEALLTVGRARPGVDLEIRDEDDRRVPDGEVGEVVLRSPTMMRGYWSDPDATAATLVDGWLHTGDLGFIDDRGLLRLAGRAKEMYIRGGYNVYPMEVEGGLATHPYVQEVVVVPRPDAVMGEIGVAVVVPRQATEPPTLEDLRAHARENLAAYKLPEAIRMVTDLPLTAMQKIDRAALAAEEAVAARSGQVSQHEMVGRPVRNEPTGQPTGSS